MSVTHVNTSQFNEEIAKDGYIIADFHAEWCPPCKIMKPIFESLSNDDEMTESGVRFLSIDVDNNQEPSQKYQVQSIPTFILIHIKSGEAKELKRWVGAQDPLTFKSEILEEVE